MNRLATETCPYLRQHADNPVDWYPWGDDAFAARPGRGQADPAVGRVLVVPLVPRDGPRVVRGRRRRRGDEPPVREREGRPRGTTRRRRDLHGGGAGADRARRLADDRVPHPRRPPVLRRHLLPEGRPPGHARVRPACMDADRRRLARPSATTCSSRPSSCTTAIGRMVALGAGDGTGDATAHAPTVAMLDQADAAAGASSTRARRVRARAEVPAGDDARLPAPRRTCATPIRRRSRPRPDARRDGRGRDLRPGRRRLPPLLDRRLLARPALREDALRPGAARRRVPARLPRHRRARGTAGSSRRRSTTCCATSATPTAASSPPRTPTARASRASSTCWSSTSSSRCAATTPPRSIRYFGVTAAGTSSDPHTGFRGNILHLVDRTEDRPDAVRRAAAALFAARASTGPARPRRQGAARLERAVPALARRGRRRARARRLDGRGARETPRSSCASSAATTVACSGRGRAGAGPSSSPYAEDYAALLEALVTLAEVDDVAWLDERACCRRRAGPALPRRATAAGSSPPASTPRRSSSGPRTSSTTRRRRRTRSPRTGCSGSPRSPATRRTRSSATAGCAGLAGVAAEHPTAFAFLLGALERVCSHPSRSRSSATAADTAGLRREVFGRLLPASAVALDGPDRPGPTPGPELTPLLADRSAVDGESRPPTCASASPAGCRSRPRKRSARSSTRPSRRGAPEPGRPQGVPAPRWPIGRLLGGGAAEAVGERLGDRPAEHDDGLALGRVERPRRPRSRPSRPFTWLASSTGSATGRSSRPERCGRRSGRRSRSGGRDDDPRPAPHRWASSSAAGTTSASVASSEYAAGWAIAAGHEHVLVGEGDRGPAVQLADQALERRPGPCGPSGRHRGPRGCTGSRRPARASRRGSRGARRPRWTIATSGKCSTCGRAVPRPWETDPCEELAELIELGRLQRDGITGFDRHDDQLWSTGRVCGQSTPNPLGGAPFAGRLARDYSTLIPRARVGRRDLRVEGPEGLEQERGDGDVADPLAICGDHVPRRVRRRRLGDDLLVGVLVLVPVLPGVEVGGLELPVLHRVLDALLDSDALLLLRDVQEAP